ncbi:Fur family transcriptional regulator [Kallotenue papyrolyticum]|uniref:Fur family transcriptional regulator n=1 Tax=Kallotenue papyrolyticum TaxID=1325125 RepID=UPI000492B6D7|nr:Fur family transcriptional regulator [Kallotenue papyrolyticum]
MRHDEVIHRLRAQGYRLTQQRRLILNALAAHHGHVSARELHRIVARQAPAINLATVYRTLHWLERVGLAHAIDAGEHQRLYEYAATDDHHHLICRSCGAQQEIDHAVFDALRERLLERYAFVADPRHIAIFGWCARCRAAYAPADAAPSRRAAP